MTKADAIATMAASPETLARKFNISRLDLLEAAAAKILEAYRADASHLDEVTTVTLSHAVALTGFTKERIVEECKTLNPNSKVVRITRAELKRLIARHESTRQTGESRPVY